MNVKVLMSTMNKENIEELNLDKKNIENCMALNQTIKNIPIQKDTKVCMISCNEKGLSKSRNRLIQNLDFNTEVAIITDDDVYFLPEYTKIVEKAYDSLEEADVIIFKTLDENNKPRRKYPNKNKKLNKRDILNVCSIEITFKTEKIKNKIYFNENFGLGAKYNSGEENLFLNECIKNNLNVYFYDEYLNIHPKESTGNTWNEKDIFDKGALFKALYPIKSYFLVLPICILKSKILEVNLFSAMRIMYKGIYKYSKEGKK